MYPPYLYLVLVSASVHALYVISGNGMSLVIGDGNNYWAIAEFLYRLSSVCSNHSTVCNGPMV